MLLNNVDKKQVNYLFYRVDRGCCRGDCGDVDALVGIAMQPSSLAGVVGVGAVTSENTSAICVIQHS